MPKKKFYRIRENKKLCGVCTGVAEYFDIDLTLVRILWVLTAIKGMGVIAYILIAILAPERQKNN